MHRASEGSYGGGGGVMSEAPLYPLVKLDVVVRFNKGVFALWEVHISMPARRLAESC